MEFLLKPIDLRRTWLVLCALILFAIVAASIQGCAALGVPTADTVNKKLAEAYIGVTAAANSVTSLRTAGKMSESERDKAVATLRTVKTGLDAVSASAPTDPAAADARLRQVLLLLSALEAGLASQQAGGK
jgi:hypothetical protein